MRQVATAFDVSRSALTEAVKRAKAERRRRSTIDVESDAALLVRIKELVGQRPSYGYRRVTALLNTDKPADEHVNHKRAYRLMKANKLLLERFTARPTRTHDGQVITLKSDLRWCSDSFELRCFNGDKVFVTFALDCCDREAMAWEASTQHPTGDTVRNLMAQSVEHRFGAGVTEVPHRIEWLSDNGAPFTAWETRAFGKELGLVVVNTPAYSPESNGMAEAFVKTFKRDYVYLAKLSDAQSALAQMAAWFEDYNEVAPHSGLRMLSPRAHRRRQAAA
jgi:putative transposase